MKSEDKVKQLCPHAFLTERHGTFMRGHTRYEIKTGPRKVIGMGMRRDWAWAYALRALQTTVAKTTRREGVTDDDDPTEPAKSERVG